MLETGSVNRSFMLFFSRRALDCPEFFRPTVTQESEFKKPLHDLYKLIEGAMNL